MGPLTSADDARVRINAHEQAAVDQNWRAAIDLHGQRLSMVEDAV